MGQKFSFMRRFGVACYGLLILVAFTGCGGSHSSSNAAFTPAPNVPAVISEFGIAKSNFIISILPSGNVTYSQSTGVVPAPTQTGTVSATLTAQFFKDLAAAMPVQNLPPFTGTTSNVVFAYETVQYQGQAGTIDNQNDAREVALASDAAAIAQALGIPQN